MTRNRSNPDDILIGEFPVAQRGDTPETRSKLADQMCHQMIDRLTSLLLCCTNLEKTVNGPWPAEHEKDLKSIEQSVQIIAELGRRLVECTRPREPQDRPA